MWIDGMITYAMAAKPPDAADRHKQRLAALDID
jgi:hypothetical protein